jgi:glutamyl-tRNA reductase
VPAVAVDAARDALGDLADRRVLIVGAGETSELTARALHEQGVATLYVANRGPERAQALAQRFGGRPLAFDALPAELERADIVVSSTASPEPIISAGEVAKVMAARPSRPLLLLDLAVPRDVDPACAAVPGVTVLDVDGLQAQVQRHRLVRHGEALRAEAIVEDEIHSFAGWLGTRDVLPTLAALRERGTAIVDQVLAENESRWEGLSERDRKRVEALAHAVANRLLHEPTLRVKGTEGEERHARLALLRDLFDLEEPAVPQGAPAEVRQLRA